MTNKSKELNTSFILLNEKLNFERSIVGNQTISIDYNPPLGYNLGYSSLELLMLCFYSCIGSSILAFFKKVEENN
ncbi:MAG: hypothetical protein ACOYO1_03090 [Bacteroidales bacterium]